MIDDLTLEEIWETRRKIYAECGNGSYKLVAYYIELQELNLERLLQEREGLLRIFAFGLMNNEVC